MAQIAGREFLTQFILPVAAIFITKTLGLGNRHGWHRAILDTGVGGVVTVQCEIISAQHAVQLEFRAEAVVQRDGRAFHIRLYVSTLLAILGAIISRDIGCDRTSAITGQALIGQPFIMQIIGLHQDPRVGCQLKLGRRSECLPFQKILIPEISRIFKSPGQAECGHA